VQLASGEICGSAKDRRQEFADGVVLDARKDEKDVEIIRNPAHNVPAPFKDDTYLAAMVANANGYHFLRRRESTGLWTHKNGAASPVETHFYDALLEKPVAITDAAVSRILEDPRLIECSMTFECFFKVPKSGVQVEG
jgi:hypothetical protein